MQEIKFKVVYHRKDMARCCGMWVSGRILAVFRWLIL
jgi:hypothetical protein